MDDAMTDQNSSDQTHTPEAMLSELESIKELLFEGDDLEEFDIPVLDHTVINEVLESPSSSAEDNNNISGTAQEAVQEDSIEDNTGTRYHPLSEQDSNSAEQALEHNDIITPEKSPHPIDQASLFQDDSTALSSHQNPVKAHGENPFLPKHIRDRLQGNRAASSNINQALPVQLEADQILDDIINQFLPAIETKLRARLKPIIDRQLADAGSNNDPL